MDKLLQTWTSIWTAGNMLKYRSTDSEFLLHVKFSSRILISHFFFSLLRYPEMTLSTTTKAAVFHGAKPTGPFLTISEIPIREPTSGEAVVEILAARVLSYASEIFDGSRPYPNLLPFVPGAGGIGIIRSIGPGNTTLQPGQLVVIDPTIRARDNAISPDIMLHGLIAYGPGPQSLQSVWNHGTWAEKSILPVENLVNFTNNDVHDLCHRSKLLLTFSFFLQIVCSTTQSQGKVQRHRADNHWRVCSRIWWSLIGRSQGRSDNCHHGRNRSFWFIGFCRCSRHGISSRHCIRS